MSENPTPSPAMMNESVGRDENAECGMNDVQSFDDFHNYPDSLLPASSNRTPSLHFHLTRFHHHFYVLACAF